MGTDQPVEGLARIRSDERARGIKLHGLRHGFASLGLAAGIRGEAMVELLGHSSTRTLKRYQDVIPALRREAADQFDRLLRVGI